ncbi:MAG TPA: hypothetical protein VNI54_06490 [Thermoanaerobaculia bacterium]|nr:hypothetical protein [Thermoanaerobaculia bacterium]
MSRYAHAVREELWSRGRRVESRLAHGEAIEEPDGSITASDKRDDAFVQRAESLLSLLRDAMPHDAVVRLVAEAGTEGESATMTVRIGPLSIVTTPEQVHEDMHLLRSVERRPLRPPNPRRPKRAPLHWKNGTAAILLHEAHAHPLEHNHAPLQLPPWLHVDVPMTKRRQSFRDIPLLRMQHVRVTQHDAPFEHPEDAIEVHMVDGGSYEPLTETVTVRVSASSIGPFELTEPRANILFLGARGEAQRYPGVVCSREGQELVVGSYAPAILTAFR